jgi:hypothetical protein
MKIILINFGRWNNAAFGGHLRRIYKRVYINGKWTPFIKLSFKYIKTNQ